VDESIGGFVEHRSLALAVTKFTAMIVINLVTSKAVAKHERLFKNLESGYNMIKFNTAVIYIYF
jgi:hypothetical protein